jgi:type VI secretion system protein ImpE
LRLSRRTEWEELAEGQYRGVGQRMFTAGETDISLLDLRTLEFKKLS